MGNELQFYIDPCNLFGEFNCTIESLYGTEQVSLLLYEKGIYDQSYLVYQCNMLKAFNTCINSDISAPVGCKQEYGVYSSHEGES